MKCSNCGSIVKENEKFCSNCGSKISISNSNKNMSCYKSNPLLVFSIITFIFIILFKFIITGTLFDIYSILLFTIGGFALVLEYIFMNKKISKFIIFYCSILGIIVLLIVLFINEIIIKLN